MPPVQIPVVGSAEAMTVHAPRPDGILHEDDPMEPERHLAAAVIGAAVRELADPKYAKDAAVFLLDGLEDTRWGEMVTLPARRVIKALVMETVPWGTLDPEAAKMIRYWLTH